MVPWMSGLVSGLQNRVRRFESARNLAKHPRSYLRGCFRLKSWLHLGYIFKDIKSPHLTYIRADFSAFIIIAIVAMNTAKIIKNPIFVMGIGIIASFFFIILMAMVPLPKQ